MLYYIILYYIILCYIILYYIILHYIILKSGVHILGMKKEYSSYIDGDIYIYIYIYILRRICNIM